MSGQPSSVRLRMARTHPRWRDTRLASTTTTERCRRGLRAAKSDEEDDPGSTCADLLAKTPDESATSRAAAGARRQIPPPRCPGCQNAAERAGAVARADRVRVRPRRRRLPLIERPALLVRGVFVVCHTGHTANDS
ncbi:uncharacterized protein TRAVEDRAFT_41372 [Trametes versicolor FP-101664 SS1]|uniref:uncharacterized protein n=1 Tax=Trametes versicolor (strain FP-101664) TaxID=717944 RepID=UPI0004621ABA|nr:uncharacterized protein TRAVEDRAFT_41372 [Trametes versicolor FP-101664 SS1]EIW63947.1 hypothetical protein TRAVEDRAFT_41372 [Trametes versicolor FP-101664 SS1]